MFGPQSLFGEKAEYEKNLPQAYMLKHLIASWDIVSIFNDLFHSLFIHVHFCIYSYVYIHIVALRSQKRTWDVLHLDVQAVVSCAMCVLGTRLWSSEQRNL